jgi:hypothetical protein
MRVFANNGADVWVNGVQLLANAKLDRRPAYWNDQVSVPASAWVSGGKRLTSTVTTALCCG